MKTPVGHSHGLLVVLSSPSGAGKSTLSRRLLESREDMALSVSATTRPRRPSEVDGIDYQFVSEKQFQDMIESGSFLEWAKVFDHYYGTPWAPIETELKDGNDIVLDIDWQGTQQVSNHPAAQANLVRIFILPPSIDALEDRLKKRGQDSAEVVNHRMSKAADELSHWAEYDYLVVNDDFDRCYQDICAILTGERLRLTRQPEATALARKLVETAKTHLDP